MKSPVVFRAQFMQPRGTWPLPTPVSVEIFHAKVGPPAQWRARRPGTKIEFPFTAQSTASTLEEQIENLYFEKRVSEWVAFDTSFDPPRRLNPSDWRQDPQGKIVFTDSYLEVLKSERQNSVTR
jgi:hypothetical protein